MNNSVKKGTSAKCTHGHRLNP